MVSNKSCLPGSFYFLFFLFDLIGSFKNTCPQPPKLFLSNLICGWGSPTVFVLFCFYFFIELFTSKIRLAPFCGLFFLLNLSLIPWVIFNFIKVAACISLSLKFCKNHYLKLIFHADILLSFSLLELLFSLESSCTLIFHFLVSLCWYWYIW